MNAACDNPPRSTPSPVSTSPINELSLASEQGRIYCSIGQFDITNRFPAIAGDGKILMEFDQKLSWLESVIVLLLILTVGISFFKS
jgi:hypothetical protein